MVLELILQLIVIVQITFQQERKLFKKIAFWLPSWKELTVR